MLLIKKGMTREDLISVLTTLEDSSLSTINFIKAGKFVKNSSQILDKLEELLESHHELLLKAGFVCSTIMANHGEQFEKSCFTDGNHDFSRVLVSDVKTLETFEVTSD